MSSVVPSVLSESWNPTGLGRNSTLAQVNIVVFLASPAVRSAAGRRATRAPKLLQLLCLSVARIYPDATVVVLADEQTSIPPLALPSAVRRVRVQPDRLMYSRLTAYATFLEDAPDDRTYLFLDADMLMCRAFALDSQPPWDVALTYKRSSSGRLNGGFILVRQGSRKAGAAFLGRALAAYSDEEVSKHDWGSDELALRHAVGLRSRPEHPRVIVLPDARVLLLPRERYNDAPGTWADVRRGPGERFLLHFTGHRKARMWVAFRLHVAESSRFERSVLVGTIALLTAAGAVRQAGRRALGAAHLRISRRSRLGRRVRARKAALAHSPYAYSDCPRVSLIVMSFNHRDNVVPIVEGLRRTAAEELIVCEDGSIDGSLKKWLSVLERRQDFLVRSNDLHEIRAYNRAIGLAQGEIVCVLQDDDIPPEDGGWVSRAVQLFDAYPRLAVLGGHQGLVMDLTSPLDRPSTQTIFGNETEAGVPTVDPGSGIPFVYVEAVNVGPIFMRREVFLRLGGFDVECSRPGDPGIVLDVALCLRVWTAGWHVGLFQPPAFRRYVGGRGTKMYGRPQRIANEVVNLRRMRDIYGDRLGEIRATIDTLNRRLDARHDK